MHKLVKDRIGERYGRYNVIAFSHEIINENNKKKYYWKVIDNTTGEIKVFPVGSLLNFRYFETERGKLLAKKARKRWYSKHKEEHNKEMCIYYEEHKDIRKNQMREYYEKNIEHLKEYGREQQKWYYPSHKEKQQAYMKEYMKEYNKKYRQEHKEYFQEYTRNHKKKKGVSNEA